MAKAKVGTTSSGPGLDQFGHEIPDPTPLSLPAGFKRPETLAEQVQRLVRTHISREAAEAGFETFEEAEDFDLPDDPDDPNTPYEEYFDPLLGRGITVQEFRQNFDVYRERYVKAEMAAYQAMEQSDALRRPYRPDGDDDRPKARPSRAASERGSSEGPNMAPSDDSER